MATIEVQLPDELLSKLTTIVERAEHAVSAAQSSLDFTKQLIDESGPIYSTLFEELKAQRQLLSDLRERLHELGNAINGKLGAYEAELFIRQLINEILDERK